MSGGVLHSKTQIYENAVRWRGEAEEKIRGGRKVDLGACYTTMSHSHFVMGLYDYIATHDVSGMKQNFYIAGKLHLSALVLNSKGRFLTPMPLLWAILSDSTSIIDEMSNFDQGEYFESRKDPRNPQFMVHMYQMAIKSDFEAVCRGLDVLRKKGRKADQIVAKNGRDFFSLLMLRDKAALENEIFRKLTAKAADPMAEGIVSIISTLEAKICWMHGIAVDIDSELVPKDFLPVRPLEKYTDEYDFLLMGYERKEPISRFLSGIIRR